MKKKAAAVGLGILGSTAAVALSGGVYASSVVEVNDVTNAMVGSAYAASQCDDSITIKSGLAKYDRTVSNFVIRDVTVDDLSPTCSGLYVTVVGLDGSEAPIVQGSAVASSPAFAVNLSNGVPLGSVAQWRIVLQDVAGDAGVEVTPPSLEGDVVPVTEGDVEPLPEPTPSPVEVGEEAEVMTAPEAQPSPSLGPSLEPTEPVEVVEPAAPAEVAVEPVEVSDTSPSPL